MGSPQTAPNATFPMYLRAWPRQVRRKPLRILYRDCTYGVLRNDRRGPLRRNLALKRYVNVADLPSFNDLMGRVRGDRDAPGGAADPDFAVPDSPSELLLCGICQSEAEVWATVPMCGERPRYPLCKECLDDLSYGSYCEDVVPL